jgi:hypothetical protein
VPNAFNGTTDLDLLKEIRRVSGELVRRFELQLAPSRPEELNATKDKLGLIQMSEHEFRGFYEKCRDLRELLDGVTTDWDEYEPASGA